ncbi:riboflavin synthase [Marinicauda algicola]|uniref:Riboflavin synthase n=1 Tax=Marinicauda algicola TaxID=2029849 RepID=A0A4S2GYA4_9PROT|nr:riboflavin synthase [Marinicauda algicola]TGY87861.1 riboflavin synthase [Marinicauda algicola]
MFTGIVTAKGRIARISGERDRRFEIECPYDPAGIALGASIAHAGACLTVVHVAPVADGARYAVEVSPETLRRTTLGAWREGDSVNLERPLKVGDELGGHIVQGHVDGVGEVVSVERSEGWLTLRVRAPGTLSRFIAEKGSIAVDGVSLTVNAVEGAVFDLMIIPHTAKVTTLGALKPGAHVNLEVDVMARYAARLAGQAG